MLITLQIEESIFDGFIDADLLALSLGVDDQSQFFSSFSLQDSTLDSYDELDKLAASSSLD
jgi:hypothetical protein